jgi:hypothetical protein
MIDLWAAYWKLWEIALRPSPAPKPTGVVIPFRRRRAK